MNRYLRGMWALFLGFLISGTLLAQDKLARKELSLPKKAQEMRFVSKLFLWKPSLEGSLAPDKILGIKPPLESAAPRLSLDDEAALGGDENFLGFEMTGSGFTGGFPSGSGIRLTYWRGTFRGEGVLSQPFDPGGANLSPGTSLSSEFGIRYLGIDFVGDPRGEISSDSSLSFEVSLGLRLYQTEFEMKTPEGTIKDRAGGFGPGLGLRGKWQALSFLAFSLELSGSGAFGVPEWQAAGGVSIHWGGATLELGYRELHLNAGPQIEEMNITLGGPTFSLSVLF